MAGPEDIIREVITGGTRSRKGKLKMKGGPLGLSSLPDPSGLKESIEGVKESIEQVVEGITGLKDIPKILLEGITEADKDFHTADKSFRKARIRGPRVRGPRKK